MTNRPVIKDAPGLTWRPVKQGWLARWQARGDIIKKGYRPSSQYLWKGAEPTPVEVAFIQDVCNRLQNEMLIWSRGGIPRVGAFDGTMAGLIDAYKLDKDSPYQKLRSKSREHYDTLCRRIEAEFGERKLSDLNARSFLAFYRTFADQGKLTGGHHYITMCRILVNFGATFIEDEQCKRLAVVLHGMRFQGGKPREERLTAAQADAIRDRAHERGKPSIALGQALQFECMLRQKDVIGEWVSIHEKTPITDVHAGNKKWIRGLRWEEIDENLTLSHVTSKRQKKLVFPLSRAPMVMQELDRQFPNFKALGRAALPVTGPVIISERLRLPYDTQEYRRQWRICATDVGVPKSVQNMDSRAGGITEATEAGADIEHVKHAATHSDIGMTQRYSRGATDKVAGVMDKRAAHRKRRQE